MKKNFGTLLVGFLLGSLFPLLLAQSNSVPPAPPAPPSNYSYVTNTNTWEVALVYTPHYEWQITFEWSDTADFAITKVYPVVVQVPFEYESGFVRVVARKVETSEDVTATTK